MAKLTKTNRPVNPRTICPGDIIVRTNGGRTYWMVGEWPGRGTRTIMDLVTGKNEQISVSELESFRLTTGVIELVNEGVVNERV